MSLGEAGVAIFFGISGYLITGSWFADPNIFRFFAKRFLRIWPALAVTVTVLWAFCHLPQQGISQLTFPIAADLFWSRNISLVFGYWDWTQFFASNPMPSLDRSLWTIPIEVQCYLVAGFSFFLLERRARFFLLPLMLVPLFVPGDTSMLGACFLAGSAMRQWKHGFMLGLIGRSHRGGDGPMGAIDCPLHRRGSGVRGFPVVAHSQASGRARRLQLWPLPLGVACCSGRDDAVGRQALADPVVAGRDGLSSVAVVALDREPCFDVEA